MNNNKGRTSVSGGSLMVWGCFFAHGRSPLVVVQGVELLDWPSRSPDAEHIWDEPGRRVRQQVNPPQTLGGLQRALVEQWRRLPQAVFTNVRDPRGDVVLLLERLEVDTMDIENISILF